MYYRIVDRIRRLGLPLSRLKWFLEGYREGDGVHSGEHLRAGVRHEFSTVSAELKDDLVVAFARFGLLASVGRYTSTLKQRTGDREYPFWRLTLCNVSPWSPLEWDRGVRQKLQARRSGDLVWAVIKGIREVEPTSRLMLKPSGASPIAITSAPSSKSACGAAL